MTRVLPMGAVEEGLWVTDEAASAVLLAALTEQLEGRALSCQVAGASGADAQDADTAATSRGANAPPGAELAGRLRASVEVAVPLDDPLPRSAERVRQAVLAAGEDRLGLPLAEVDVRVAETVSDVSDE